MDDYPFDLTPEEEVKKESMGEEGYEPEASVDTEDTFGPFDYGCAYP